jgi:hypothetical protein
VLQNLTDKQRGVFSEAGFDIETKCLLADPNLMEKQVQQGIRI